MPDATAASVNAPQSRRYGVQTGEPPWFIATRLVERHLLSLAALLLVPLTWPLFVLFVASYVVRMFGAEGVYHRYFSHRSYAASRPVQFLLALVGLQSGHRGPLWWAITHRNHHKYTETEQDPHSPVVYGFGYGYSRWLMDRRNGNTDLDAIADFARFPELRWLNRYHMVVYYGGALALCLAAYVGWLGDGITWWAALLWGFYVPATLTLHSVAIVNTLCHMPDFPGGYRRYDTHDNSVNRPLIGILALGGGYHNNHHRQGALARSGFAWYEFDVVYFILRALQSLRVICKMKSDVPREILEEGGIRAA